MGEIFQIRVEQGRRHQSQITNIKLKLPLGTLQTAHQRYELFFFNNRLVLLPRPNAMAHIKSITRHEVHANC